MFSYLKNMDLEHEKRTVDFSDMERIIDIPKIAHLSLMKKRKIDIEYAIKLIDKLLDMQEVRPQSSHYGLWFLQEKTPDGTSNIYDKNATTYIGIPLFVILAEYSDILPGILVKKIENSLSIACIYILNRNIHFQNTHITIAESFLTAACGERLQNPEFINYAINLFQNFYHYNIADGCFTEYNSPYYDKNNIYILYLAKRYIKNELYLRLTDITYDALWEIVATHYHYETNCIAGPIHRLTSLFPDPDMVSFFTNNNKTVRQKNTDLSFENMCPQRFRQFFSGSKQDTYSQKIVSHGSSYPYYLYSKIATTLIKPSYCIGSFCRGECWEEFAPFLGYFGSSDSRFAIKVTTIHDGHEYSSAQLSTVQYRNCILGHTTFATDRGDRHIEYDLTNGKIRAKDLRIRFWVSGDVSGLTAFQDKNTLILKHKKVKLQFTYSLAKFGKFLPKIELSKEKDLFFDMVLYSGKSITINFNELNKAIVSWFFYISDNAIPALSAENKFSNKILSTNLIVDSDKLLSLTSYCKPDTQANIHINNRQFIQGTQLEKFVLRTSRLMEQYSYITDYTSSSPFELNLKDNKNIISMLYSLKDVEEGDIIPTAKKIFSTILKNRITIMLVKRIAIQIMTYAFEFYKNESIHFSSVIQDYSQLYQFNISSANDTETVAYNVFEILNILHSMYKSSDYLDSDIELINQITDLIEDRYYYPDLSREYIAEQCGKSVYSVSRAFKKISSLTYIDYLTNIRINHAKDYLKNTNLTIEDIGKKVGYLNLSSFIRTFRKKTGETPSKYRNSNKT